MVHRILIRESQAVKLGHSRFFGYSTIGLVPLLIALSLNRYWGKFESLAETVMSTTAENLTPVSAVVLVVLSLLISLRSRGSKNDRCRGIAVMIYPIGVQLTEVSMKDDDDIGSNYLQENPRFIPRDQIVDCVVTEVVLAHRVQSVVVFRVSTSKDRHSGSFQLINAFPGVNLTYRECLSVRGQIMDCLRNPRHHQRSLYSGN